MDFSCQLPIFGWIFPPNGRPAGSAARGAEERPSAAVRRAGAAGRQGDAAGGDVDELGGGRVGYNWGLPPGNWT